jgi:hypothetical protein
MSPELETLDQLLGGDLSLAIVRDLYPDTEAFSVGLTGLLSNGDVCLYDLDGSEVPDWQWHELFRDGSVVSNLANLKLKITQQGVRRVA